MFLLVTGGAAGGKSEYAEKRVIQLGNPSVYVATMHQDGQEETLDRIRRHRTLREGKGFVTVECSTGISKVCDEGFSGNSTILVECMTNLLANEMYLAKRENVVDYILSEVKKLVNTFSDVVVVTGEIGCDGMEYDDFSMEYIKNLAKVNAKMAQCAHEVVEVVYSIPVQIKGDGQ